MQVSLYIKLVTITIQKKFPYTCTNLGKLSPKNSKTIFEKTLWKITCKNPRERGPPLQYLREIRM